MRQICVIDGRGGGLGRRLVARLCLLVGASKVVGLGTNAAAARSMQEAGARQVVIDGETNRAMLSEADLIVGPLGIVLPGALSGEVTVGLVTAVLRSPARKLLLPVNQHSVEVVGAEGRTLEALIHHAVQRIESACHMAQSI